MTVWVVGVGAWVASCVPLALFLGRFVAVCERGECVRRGGLQGGGACDEW